MVRFDCRLLGLCVCVCEKETKNEQNRDCLRKGGAGSPPTDLGEEVVSWCDRHSLCHHSIKDDPDDEVDLDDVDDVDDVVVMAETDQTRHIMSTAPDTVWYLSPVPGTSYQVPGTWYEVRAGTKL